MVRGTSVLLAGLVLALAGAAHAADAPPIAGNWKVFLQFSQQPTKPFWILKLETQEGKWIGTVSSMQGLPETAIDKIAVKGGKLTFTLKLAEDTLPFEIKIPKEAGDKMYGVVLLNKRANPVALEKTTLKSLDSFEVNKEILAKTGGSAEVVMAGLDLLQQAKKKNVKKDEAAGWADKVAKIAEQYGPRFQRETTLRLAEILGGEEEYADLGVDYARKAEKLLTAKDKPTAHKHVLELLAAALENAGKKDEAKEVTEKIKKIDTSFKPEPFAGRKSKSDRVALVELFTGAHCPPCVAADLAFDAVGHAYKPSDVVLLQYHLHIPRPDALTNPDTEARAKFYADAVNGTPTVLFNGKPSGLDGGSKDDASDKYDEFTGLLDPLLEEPAKLKLTASAVQKGDKIEIVAAVSDVAKPSDELRLRLALVEDKVEYPGTNKLTEHHNVVRARSRRRGGLGDQGQNRQADRNRRSGRVEEKPQGLPDEIRQGQPEETVSDRGPAVGVEETQGRRVRAER